MHVVARGCVKRRLGSFLKALDAEGVWRLKPSSKVRTCTEACKDMGHKIWAQKGARPREVIEQQVIFPPLVEPSGQKSVRGEGLDASMKRESGVLERY
jgi:hypothetical protein